MPARGRKQTKRRTKSKSRTPAASPATPKQGQGHSRGSRGAASAAEHLREEDRQNEARRNRPTRTGAAERAAAEQEAGHGVAAPNPYQIEDHSIDAWRRLCPGDTGTYEKWLARLKKGYNPKQRARRPEEEESDEDECIGLTKEEQLHVVQGKPREPVREPEVQPSEAPAARRDLQESFDAAADEAHDKPDAEADEEPSLWERIRNANIERNKELLGKLGFKGIEDFKKQAEKQEELRKKRAAKEKKTKEELEALRKKQPTRKCNEEPDDDDDKPLVERRKKPDDTGRKKRRTREEVLEEREQKKLKRDNERNQRELLKQQKRSQALGVMPPKVSKIYREFPDELPVPRDIVDCSTVKHDEYIRGKFVPGSRKRAHMSDALRLLHREMKVVITHRFSDACSKWSWGKPFRFLKQQLGNVQAQQLLKRVVTEVQDLHPACDSRFLSDMIKLKLQQTRPGRYHKPGAGTTPGGTHVVVIDSDSGSDGEQEDEEEMRRKLDEAVEGLDPRLLLRVLEQLPQEPLRMRKKAE